MYDLSGKVALVTGAGGERGIGRAIALRLAREGADVAVADLAMATAGSREWGGIGAVAREIEGMGRRSLAVTTDVTDAHQVDAMVEQVVEALGGIDILVNCAAAPAGPDRVPVVDLEEDVWDLVQRVNVKGTFLCCRAVARAMIARGAGGRIINMSSTSGKRSAARFAAYSASKFAVRGFTQALAWELGRHGITVNALCPALVDSERADRLAAALAPRDAQVEAWQKRYLEEAGATTAIGRMTTVSDVANMVAFLASSESDTITGQSLILSGGALMD